MTRLPLARSADLVTQESDGELLVFDLNKNRALCLNETAKIVFSACDGMTSVESLLQKHNSMNRETVELALLELERENLLSDLTRKEADRRMLIRKAALAAIALPVVSAVALPKAVHAQSCGPVNSSCGSAANCCPGLDCQTKFSGMVCCIPSGGPCNLFNPGDCCLSACLSTSGGSAGTCL